MGTLKSVGATDCTEYEPAKATTCWPQLTFREHRLFKSFCIFATHSIGEIGPSHSCYAHFRIVGWATQVPELCLELNVTSEGLMPVANEEDADTEEHKTANCEYSDKKVTVFHISILRD
jgi:hypothetical protein